MFVKDFSNLAIETDNLPQIDKMNLKPIDKAYLNVMYVSDAFLLLIGIVATIAASVTWWLWIAPIGIALTLVIITLLIVAQRIAIEHFGYLLREHDLTFCQGVFMRSTSTVPFVRVQHIGVDRGPVLRYFGLAVITLKTAGGNITVRGLKLKEANRIKEFVLSRANNVSDDEDK